MRFGEALVVENTFTWLRAIGEGCPCAGGDVVMWESNGVKHKGKLYFRVSNMRHISREISVLCWVSGIYTD